MRYLTLLLFACCASPANADWFHRMVGYTCEPVSNRLVVYYRGAWNEKGEAMLGDKGPNDWNPGMLIASMRDDDHIGTLTTVRRKCRLKGGAYDLSIGPTPGNFNIQGRCGAVVTAWIEIRKGKRLVLRRHELEGDCHDDETLVTTEVTVTPGSPPVVTKVTREEFMRE